MYNYDDGNNTPQSGGAEMLGGADGRRAELWSLIWPFAGVVLAYILWA